LNKLKKLFIKVSFLFEQIFEDIFSSVKFRNGGEAGYAEYSGLVQSGK